MGLQPAPVGRQPDRPATPDPEPRVSSTNKPPADQAKVAADAKAAAAKAEAKADAADKAADQPTSPESAAGGGPPTAAGQETPAHLSPGNGPGVHSGEGTPAKTDVHPMDGWPDPKAAARGPQKGKNLRLMHEIPPFRKGDIVPPHAFPTGHARHLELGAVAETDADPTVNVPDLPPPTFGAGSTDNGADAERIVRAKLTQESEARFKAERRCKELEQQCDQHKAECDRLRHELDQAKAVNAERERVRQAELSGPNPPPAAVKAGDTK